MLKSSPGTPSLAMWSPKITHRRGHDRQGGRGSARAGERPRGVGDRRPRDKVAVGSPLIVFELSDGTVVAVPAAAPVPPPGGQRPGAGRCAGRCAGRTNGRTAGRTARGGQGPRDDIAGESAPRARGGDRSCQRGRLRSWRAEFCEPTCRPARSARRRPMRLTRGHG